jgi:hypothetical protein
LLEGDESQAGQTIHCPVCQMLFIIPAPLESPPEPAAPQVEVHVGGSAPKPGTAPAVPQLLHIPCPAGHVLDTPREMLDQEGLCTQCGVQFRLREKDSVEAKQKKAEQDELRMIKQGNQWLNYAIVAAVLVLLLIGGLIVMKASS